MVNVEAGVKVKPQKKPLAVEKKARPQPKKRDRSKLWAPKAPTEGVITLLVDKNPKVAGSASAKRFACYRNGMTVAEYGKAILAGGWPKAKIASGLRWDLAHGFISVK
jgi:hypothetical protein